MRPELRERMRRCNALADQAREDGYLVYRGWVWTREAPSSPRPSRRECPLEEYGEYREKEERNG